MFYNMNTLGISGNFALSKKYLKLVSNQNN